MTPNKLQNKVNTTFEDLKSDAQETTYASDIFYDTEFGVSYSDGLFEYYVNGTEMFLESFFTELRLAITMEAPLSLKNGGDKIGVAVSYGEGLVDPDYKKRALKKITKASGLSKNVHIITSNKKKDKSISFHDVMHTKVDSKAKKKVASTIAGFRSVGNIHSKRPKIYRKPSVWA